MSLCVDATHDTTGYDFSVLMQHMILLVMSLCVDATHDTTGYDSLC